MSDQESEEPELPEGLSLKEAYAVVRSWFKADLLERSDGISSYSDWAQRYIAGLPDPDQATEDEMLELLHEVGTHRLEGAYWERDEDGYYLGAYYERFSDRDLEWQARRSGTRPDSD